MVFFKEWICMIWKQLFAEGDDFLLRIIDLILIFKDFARKSFPPINFFGPLMKSSSPKIFHSIQVLPSSRRGDAMFTLLRNCRC